jgi:LmbE family N-acetylglucosaminyl deacetylase
MTSNDLADETSAPTTSVEHLADRLPRHPVLLAVWAHPDDESYLGAGLMAEVARRGGRVVSVTATAGEHGTDDPTRWPPDRLAAHRRAELDRALAALGAEPAIVLGHPDGACARVVDAIGATIVREMVERVDPDLVLGFGDDGVTGHPDHRAVARWTELAVGEVPFVATAAGTAWPVDCVEQMRAVHAFWPGFPRRRHDAGSVRVTLDGEILERKLAALRCHAHQVAPVRALLGARRFRTLAAAEAYRPVNRAAADLIDTVVVGAAA